MHTAKEALKLILLVLLILVFFELGSKLAHFIVHDVFRQLEPFQGPTLAFKITNLFLSIILPFGISIFFIHKFIKKKTIGYVVIIPLFIFLLYLLYK